MVTCVYLYICTGNVFSGRIAFIRDASWFIYLVGTLLPVALYFSPAMTISDVLRLLFPGGRRELRPASSPIDVTAIENGSFVYRDRLLPSCPLQCSLLVDRENQLPRTFQKPCPRWDSRGGMPSDSPSYFPTVLESSSEQKTLHALHMQSVEA